MDAQATPGPGEEAAAEVRRVLLRAEQGDESALPELRTLLDARGYLWLHLSDLSRRAEDALLRLAGQNPLAREALSRRLALLKGELATPDASPLARLLAERLALCWLAVHVAELDAAADHPAGGPRARELERRLDRAHRRFVTAARQLMLLGILPRPCPSPSDLPTRSPEERVGPCIASPAGRASAAPFGAVPAATGEGEKTPAAEPG